jgi:hypothetical protein
VWLSVTDKRGRDAKRCHHGKVANFTLQLLSIGDRVVLMNWRKQSRAVSTQSGTLAWAGYAACVWCCVFAAMSFYWATGGIVGFVTLSPGIQKLALEPDPTFTAILWITGILKLVGGLLALALVRSWDRLIPRWMLLAVAWVGCVVMVVHGGDFLVRGMLWMSGVVNVPESVSATVIYGYALVWGPWWLLGGILFGATAWHYQRGL